MMTEYIRKPWIECDGKFGKNIMEFGQALIVRCEYIVCLNQAIGL